MKTVNLELTNFEIEGGTLPFRTRLHFVVQSNEEAETTVRYEHGFEQDGDRRAEIESLQLPEEFLTSGEHTMRNVSRETLEAFGFAKLYATQ